MRKNKSPKIIQFQVTKDCLYVLCIDGSLHRMGMDEDGWTELDIDVWNVERNDAFYKNLESKNNA